MPPYEKYPYENCGVFEGNEFQEYLQAREMGNKEEKETAGKHRTIFNLILFPSLSYSRIRSGLPELLCTILHEIPFRLFEF